METASFVFRGMTQCAAASSAPHSSQSLLSPAQEHPPTPPLLPGGCWAEGRGISARTPSPPAWAARPAPHPSPSE